MKITTFNPLIVTKETIETQTSKIAIMVAPSGFILSVSEHIRN